MSMILVAEHRHGPLSRLLPDERLSSWIARQSSAVQLIPHDLQRGLQAHHTSERDYGRLIIQDPDITAELAAQLIAAAQWPAPFIRPPDERAIGCWGCLFERWALGQTLYWPRRWTVAWCTCCPLHGPYAVIRWLPRELEDWPECLHASPNQRSEFMLLRLPGPRIEIPINLFGDCRGEHLEAALNDITRCEWHPRGLNQEALHRCYAAIIYLLRWTYDWHRLNGHLMETTYRLPMRVSGKACWPGMIRGSERRDIHYWFPPKKLSTHQLNVLAEAILATWTKSPLPTRAGADERTRLLTGIIGWDIEDSSNKHCASRRPPLKSYRQFYDLGPSYEELCGVADLFPAALREDLRRRMPKTHGPHPVCRHEDAIMRYPEPVLEDDPHQKVVDEFLRMYQQTK